MSPALLALLLHLPNASGPGDHGAPASAWPVEDIATSIVLYDVVECSAEELWMRFDGTAGAPLYVQLGIPVIDRLTDYRPSFAVLAPGLPELALPFETPDGLGGIRFDTSDVTVPGDFYEPFSQTSSWILEEVTVNLPEDGTGYIVAWDPQRMTGKQWIAVGTIEDFSGGLPIPIDTVKEFHEIPGFEPATPVQEESCGEPVPPPGAEDDGGSGDDGGDDGGLADEGTDGGMAADMDTDPMTSGCACGVGDDSSRVPGWLAFALLPLVRRRRHSSTNRA